MFYFFISRICVKSKCIDKTIYSKPPKEKLKKKFLSLNKHLSFKNPSDWWTFDIQNL